MKTEDTSTILKDYMDISVKRKGETYYFRAIAKPITNLEGESIGVVTLMQDITKLKELDELKSEFIASVSHELRTPLTSMLMAAELLQNEIPGKINQKQQEMIGIMIEDGKRLKDLINDILDLSRLESGKIQLNIKKHNLGDIIDYVLKILNIQLKEKNLNIKVNLEKNLPQVKADFSKISQVVTNLISNSINYNKKNKKLRIEVGAKTYNDNKILFYVKDNGIGIPGDDKNKIFDKFVRLDQYDDTQIQGTGLGLAISKSIIKSHGGDICVDSIAGRGSVFYFTLDYIKDFQNL